METRMPRSMGTRERLSDWIADRLPVPAGSSGRVRLATGLIIEE